MGAINADGIRLALEAEHIPEKHRSEYIRKIATFMSAASAASNKDK